MIALQTAIDSTDNTKDIMLINMRSRAFDIQPRISAEKMDPQLYQESKEEMRIGSVHKFNAK